MRPLVTPFSMKGEHMEYKDTLNMPDTGFEMRGNLPNKEPQILKRWEEEDHYHKILEKNEGADRCLACGACEKACPQHLQIIEGLQRAWQELHIE